MSENWAADVPPPDEDFDSDVSDGEYDSELPDPEKLAVEEN